MSLFNYKYNLYNLVEGDTKYANLPKQLQQDTITCFLAVLSGTIENYFLVFADDGIFFLNSAYSGSNQYESGHYYFTNKNGFISADKIITCEIDIEDNNAKIDIDTYEKDYQLAGD